MDIVYVGEVCMFDRVGSCCWLEGLIGVSVEFYAWYDVWMYGSLVSVWLMDGLGDYLGSRTGGGRVGDLRMMEAGWYVDDGW